MENLLGKQFLAMVSPWTHYTNPELHRAFPICDDELNPVNPWYDFPNNGQLFLHQAVNIKGHDLIMCEILDNSNNFTPEDSGSSMYRCTQGHYSHNIPDNFMEVVPVNDTWIMDTNELNGLNFKPTREFCILSNNIIWGPFRGTISAGRAPYNMRLKTLNPDHTVIKIGKQILEGDHGLVVCPIATDNHNTIAERIFLRSPQEFIKYFDMPEYVVDLIDDQELVEWVKEKRIFASWDPTILQQVKTITSSLPAQPNHIIQTRVQRLQKIIEKAEGLEESRASIIKYYLGTERGQQDIQAAVARAVIDEIRLREEDIVSAIAQIQKEVNKKEQELLDINQRLSMGKDELDNIKIKVEEELQVKTEFDDALKESIQSNTQELLKRILPFSILLPNLVMPSVSSEVTETDVTNNTEQIIIPKVNTHGFKRITNELAYIQDCVQRARELGYKISEDDFTNLYLCMKSGYLTVLAGYPGSGKSSLVRMFVSTLGHVERLLEIPVRRGWTDDQQFLGFVNHLYGRYEAAPTGIIQHLLAAANDLNETKKGLFPVLLDEFNLSSPEYYFSQFISAMEKDEALLTLHSNGTRVDNANIYKPIIPIGGNVHFFATVNVDESTMLLSPRVLDRANVIWVEYQWGEEDLKQIVADYSEKSTINLSAMGQLGYDQISETLNRPAKITTEQEEALKNIMNRLYAPNEETGRPIFYGSHRIIRDIVRYCTLAEGLLPPMVALDYQVCQRILPSVNGFGETMYRSLNSFMNITEKFELTKTTGCLKRMIERGRERADDYNFFW